MTTQRGRRRAPRRSRRAPVARVIAATVGLGAGAAVAGGAWFFLVRAAINFGHSARGGDTLGWAFLLGASLGAVACLVLVLVLIGRMLAAVGLVSDYQPRRAAARRGAATGP